MFVLSGVTGSGKTAALDRVQGKYPVRAINIDAYQRYPGLDVGTARGGAFGDLFSLGPAAAYRGGTEELGRPHGVFSHVAFVDEAVKSASVNGEIPVVIGGSMFYVNSLIFRPQLKRKDALGEEWTVNESEDKETRRLAELAIKSRSESLMRNLLKRIDPAREAEISVGDVFRLSQALRMWLITGTKPSLSRPQFLPNGEVIIFFTDMDDELILERIRLRAERMFRSGKVIEEVIRAIKTNSVLRDVILRRRPIGYEEALLFYQGEITLQRAIDSTVQKTMRLVKTQRKWLRYMKRKIGEKDHIPPEMESSFSFLEKYFEHEGIRIEAFRVCNSGGVILLYERHSTEKTLSQRLDAVISLSEFVVKAMRRCYKHPARSVL